MQRRAVVLVNLGSPPSSSVPDVRSYLKEFLMDPNVIDLPSWIRYLLVHAIIVPFRSVRSSRLYEKLGKGGGFPLIYHSTELNQKVRKQLPDEVDLFLGMRYGKPSLKRILQQIRNTAYDELLIFPLYPQYASSTSGSVIKLLSMELKGSPLYEKTRIIPQFHNEFGFIDLWQKKISAFKPETYDAIVFSYHGIPIRQTRIAHPEKSCEILKCEQNYTGLNEYCYHASCYQTTKSIAEGLNIGNDRIFTSFQSRFGRNWLEPYTDQVLLKLARDGRRKILIISPSFVADCLETTIEIGHEYKELFRKAGGELLTLVPSLNSDTDWISFIARVATDPNQNSIRLKNWTTSLKTASK